MKYQVLLYYCYSNIEDVVKYRNEHHLFCVRNNLRGRIIISSEGLNGTVSGSEKACRKYMDYVLSDDRFAKTEFKVDSCEEHTFQKLHVRVKKEIVNSSLGHIDPNVRTGKYVEPEEFAKILDSEDVVVLDVRSNYEHKMGRFKNALTLDIDNFREFPEKVKELENLKDKKIVTYCTGGIKCEKASAYLLEQGFEDVSQLHGGIIKYGLETDGNGFEGTCYVFDGRLHTDINKVAPSVISECFLCQAKSDHMVNCANPKCNRHVAICENCIEEYEGACSEDCFNHPERRPYNGSGYYQKESNGYSPMQAYHQSKGKAMNA